MVSIKERVMMVRVRYLFGRSKIYPVSSDLNPPLILVVGQNYQILFTYTNNESDKE